MRTPAKMAMIDKIIPVPLNAGMNGIRPVSTSQIPSKSKPGLLILLMFVILSIAYLT
jgi:hypothetical protein